MGMGIGNTTGGVALSLVKLPHEFKPVEGLIAASLGPVYAANPHNIHLQDPCFCIGIDITAGWPLTVALKGLEGKLNTILINYEHTPMRCQFCLSLNHRVADCVALKLNGVDEAFHRGKPASKPLVPKTIEPQSKFNVYTEIVTPLNRRNSPSHLAANPDSSCPEDLLSLKVDKFTQVRPRHRASRSRQANPLPLTQVPHGASTSPRPNSLPSGCARSKQRNSPKEPIDPQPPFTSEQVWNLLDASNNSDADEDTMAWSPPRYGRNPSSKRSASTSNSSCKKLAECHSPEKSDSSQLPPPSSDLPYTPPPVLAGDSPIKIRILYDKAPAEAFKEIEDKTTSSQSDLRLDQYTSQELNLSSPNLTQCSNSLNCCSQHLL